jgi:hypothetical protein
MTRTIIEAFPTIGFAQDEGIIGAMKRNITGPGALLLVSVAASISLAAPLCAEPPLITILPSDPAVAVMGRVAHAQAGRLRIGYPGVTLRLRFESPTLALRVACDTPDTHIGVALDGAPERPIRLQRGENDVILAQGLAASPHEVDVVHRTETWQGILTVDAILLAPGGRLLTPTPWPERRLLVIGDSVTCGEAIDREPGSSKDPSWWNPSSSYGMLLARALGAQCHLVCFGGRGLVRDWRGKRDVLNAPQFFDLAIPEELDAPKWDHAAYVPDAVVVSLGTNDFSLSIGDFPEREDFVSAYVLFASAIRARYPAAHVFLTDGAIVSDDGDPKRPQRTALREHLAEVVRRLDDPRVRFVAGRQYPGDAQDAHPTREQHAAMARDLEPVLRPALGW